MRIDTSLFALNIFIYRRCKMENEHNFKKINKCFCKNIPYCCNNCCITGSTGPTGPTGSTGVTGPTGPTGSMGNTISCFCVEQMRNIIQQIITLYPNDILSITLESGNNVSGRAGSLLPSPNTNPNSGIFQLKNNQGALEEGVMLCKIAAIAITSATYNNSITFLNAPSPLPEGCDTNCQSAIISYLPEGTASVSIQVSSRTVATGTILKNKFGMIVVVGNNNSNPTFVSPCKVEIINKY